MNKLNSLIKLIGLFQQLELEHNALLEALHQSQHNNNFLHQKLMENVRERDALRSEVRIEAEH